MHVDASNVPASSILAIVVTLASVALLSFLLRVCTRGGRLRSRGTDDWVLLAAATCVMGVLVLVVVLCAGKQTWPTASDDQTTSLLLWVVTLLHILGNGFVKLSVALTMLRLDMRTWHRHTVLGYICLATILTVFWFGTALLFGGPITVDWGSTNKPDAIWRLLDFVHSILDLTSTVVVALLPLPLLWVLLPALSVKIVLVVVYALTLAAIAAASARTYFLHTLQQDGARRDPPPITVICSYAELTLGMTAASLLTLPRLISTINQRLHDHRITKHLSASTNSTAPRYPSHTHASTDTVIHRPSHPHLPTLRFHDNESNLTFDIENTPRTRTHTLRSRTTHSRNISDWSQFSGFTYYTTTAASLPTSPRRSRVVSVSEMEARTRVLGGGRAADENIGVAVTTLSDTPVREEAGQEMEELARLFADKSLEWGLERERSGGIDAEEAVVNGLEKDGVGSRR